MGTRKIAYTGSGRDIAKKTKSKQLRRGERHDSVSADMLADRDAHLARINDDQALGELLEVSEGVAPCYRVPLSWTGNSSSAPQESESRAQAGVSAWGWTSCGCFGHRAQASAWAARCGAVRS